MSARACMGSCIKQMVPSHEASLYFLNKCTGSSLRRKYGFKLQYI